MTNKRNFLSFLYWIYVKIQHIRRDFDLNILKAENNLKKKDSMKYLTKVKTKTSSVDKCWPGNFIIRKLKICKYRIMWSLLSFSHIKITLNLLLMNKYSHLLENGRKNNLANINVKKTKKLNGNTKYILWNYYYFF